MASVRRWHSGWQTRWRDPAGRQRTKSFRRKSDAKQFANRVEVEKERGTYVDPQLGKLLFADWAHEWLQTKMNLRASSWTRDESYLRNHVMPTFGNIALARIDKLLVQAWVRELVEKGLHPATVKECYRILRSILNEAADSRLIVESPCRNVTLPRVPKTEQRFLSAGQVEQLAEATDPQFRALFTAPFTSGAAGASSSASRRARLSLLKREVRIVGTLEEVPGGVRYVEETKTSASRRTIIIPAFLVDLLAAHLKRAPESEFVFSTKDGSPIRRSNFRQRVWKPAVKTPGPDEHLRFHDLRHTCAVAVDRAGRSPEGDPGPARSLLDHHDSGPLRPPDAVARTPTRSEPRRDARRRREDVDQTWTKGDAEVISVPRAGRRKHRSTCGFGGWAVLGSNQRPLRCKRSALPLS